VQKEIKLRLKKQKILLYEINMIRVKIKPIGRIIFLSNFSEKNLEFFFFLRGKLS